MPSFTHCQQVCFVERAFDGNKMEGGERGSTLFIRLIVRAEIKNRSPHTPPPPPHSTRQRNKTNSLGMMSHYSACWKFLKHFVLLFHLLSFSSSFFHLLILPSHHVLLLPLVYCICFNVFFLHISFVVTFSLLLLLFDFLLYRHPVYFLSFVALVFFLHRHLHFLPCLLIFINLLFKRVDNSVDHFSI